MVKLSLISVQHQSSHSSNLVNLVSISKTFVFTPRILMKLMIQQHGNNEVYIHRWLGVRHSADINRS